MNHNTAWQGRDDSAERGDTRRLFHIVRESDAGFGPGDMVLLGFACDDGVRRNHGRPGARHGPAAIRRMVAGLPAHDLSPFWDAGDVVCEDGDIEAAQNRLAVHIARVLDAGALPLTLGGGHEVAWGSFQGLAMHLEAQASAAHGNILVLNLDAHFDLRTSRPGSSGTPFDQILEQARRQGLPVHYACLGIARTGNTRALFDHADALGVTYFEDTAMQESCLAQRLDDVQGLLAQADIVYLTIDLDVLPAGVVPGVSAPAVLGVPLHVVETLVRAVKDSGKLRLADIAEMNPDFDRDNQTARVAARLVWNLL
ncbi:formimidoylglutamase [Allopusillimonas soli]|uniref:formimidoylglutamase n=1 Tax=Allopusillimonas soli TaxID=659016 RepID=UPI001C553CFB|nr:formimidoylglutamase [Allopusillimonas soli]